MDTPVQFEDCSGQSDTSTTEGESLSLPPPYKSHTVDYNLVASIEYSVPDERAWELIPFDICWGAEYHGYQPGLLPGPDNTTSFLLRSPTPPERQRTERACEKCRRRKAKVHPSFDDLLIPT